MIQQNSWKQMLQGKHPVILGITYRAREEDYPKVVSFLGTPDSNHSQFGRKYDRYKLVTSWRYVPYIKTIYWWNKFEDIEKEATINYLKDKYNETPLYNKIVTWGAWDALKPYSKKSLMATAALRLTHGQTDYPSKDVQTGEFKWPQMPTFKQWFKMHQSGD